MPSPSIKTRVTSRSQRSSRVRTLAESHLHLSDANNSRYRMAPSGENGIIFWENRWLRHIAFAFSILHFLARQSTNRKCKIKDPWIRKDEGEVVARNSANKKPGNHGSTSSDIPTLRAQEDQGPRLIKQASDLHEKDETDSETAGMRGPCLMEPSRMCMD